MSNWVHIIGSMYIETFKKRKNIKKYVENIIKDAPKITGSEEDADIFINALSGYNLTSYKNGNHIHYQTCVCITIAGDLRDRCMDITKKEFDAFVKYIKKDFGIRDSSIKIYEEYNKDIKEFKESWYNE